MSEVPEFKYLIQRQNPVGEPEFFAGFARADDAMDYVSTMMPKALQIYDRETNTFIDTRNL